jgi:hypothetical protein
VSGIRGTGASQHVVVIAVVTRVVVHGGDVSLVEMSAVMAARALLLTATSTVRIVFFVTMFVFVLRIGPHDGHGEGDGDGCLVLVLSLVFVRGASVLPAPID